MLNTTTGAHHVNGSAGGRHQQPCNAAGVAATPRGCSRSPRCKCKDDKVIPCCWHCNSGHIMMSHPVGLVELQKKPAFNLIPQSRHSGRSWTPLAPADLPLHTTQALVMHSKRLSCLLPAMLLPAALPALNQPVANDFVLHARVSLAPALQLVKVVSHHLCQRNVEHQCGAAVCRQQACANAVLGLLQPCQFVFSLIACCPRSCCG